MSKLFSDTATLEAIGHVELGHLQLEFSLDSLGLGPRHGYERIHVHFYDSGFDSDAIKLRGLWRREGDAPEKEVLSDAFFKAARAARAGWGEEWQAIFDTKPGSEYDPDPTWASFELGGWMSSAIIQPPTEDKKPLGEVIITTNSPNQTEIKLSDLDGTTTRKFGAHLGQIYIRFVRRRL